MLIQPEVKAPAVRAAVTDDDDALLVAETATNMAILVDNEILLDSIRDAKLVADLNRRHDGNHRERRISLHPTRNEIRDVIWLLC
jgi:hypothetical protein